MTHKDPSHGQCGSLGAGSSPRPLGLGQPQAQKNEWVGVFIHGEEVASKS